MSVAKPASTDSNAGEPPAKPVADPAEPDAWVLHNRGDLAEALDQFNTILSRMPASVGALQGKVASLRKLRDFTAASRALAVAIEAHPHEPGLLAERAWLYLDQKRYDDAIAALDQVLATGHAEEGIHLHRIQLLRLKRRFREAEDAIVIARRTFPGSPHPIAEAGWLAFDQHAYDDAIIAFDAVLGGDPCDASAWQGKVASLRKSERLVQAEEAAASALARCPDAIGILAERGWLAFDRGDFGQAEAEFGRAAKRAPHDPQVKVCLALAQIRQETEPARAAAAAELRAALRLDPNIADAHGYLGVIAFKRGRLREAENHLLRSTEVDPARGSYADLGALYAQMGRTREARRSLEVAIRNDPDNAFAHIQMGSLLLREGEAKSALESFSQALSVDPSNPDAHNALAVGLIELGRLSEAEMTLRGALRKLDANKRAGLHVTLCQLLARMGDDDADVRYYEDALKEAGNALMVKPFDAAAHFSKGVVKFKLDDLPSALACFQRCLVYDREHLQADLNLRRVQVILKRRYSLTQPPRWASLGLGVFLFLQLAMLWWFYLTTSRINQAVFAALVPVLLGLIVVAIMLPSLSRLKLTGIEAELSVASPKDTLASGPQGDVGFGASAPRPH